LIQELPQKNQTPRTIVILQSNYIPWKGYFDLMNAADEFVLFDEVQFTRRDWRNRNKIIVDGQPKWLTIPVQSKDRYHATVNEMCVSDDKWAQKHLATIKHAYRKAPFFKDYLPLLEDCYAIASGMERLSDINRLFLERLAPLLGIKTPMTRSEDVPRTTDAPDARLVEICLARSGTDYLSGPAAKSYIDRTTFTKAGVGLHYADYTGYPEYPQASEVFEHGVSVIDLIMWTGVEAASHLKSRQSFAAITETA
jgi:hypothetical protein